MTYGYLNDKPLSSTDHWLEALYKVHRAQPLLYCCSPDSTAWSTLWVTGLLTDLQTLQCWTTTTKYAENVFIMGIHRNGSSFSLLSARVNTILQQDSILVSPTNTWFWSISTISRQQKVNQTVIFGKARRWLDQVSTTRPVMWEASTSNHTAACVRMFVGQLVCLWNRSKTLVDVTSLLACCSLTRCCTLRLMSARLRSAITPCRRCSRFPARLRPFFRCRGSKSIFFGFTHLHTHTHTGHAIRICRSQQEASHVQTNARMCERRRNESAISAWT